MMTRVSAIVMVVSALVSGTGELVAQDPVALIVRVQGTVAVRHGDSEPSPASVGERIFVGDEILPESGSRAILITQAGSQQVVAEQTEITAPTGAGNPDMWARAMSTLAQAAATDASAGGRQGMIRPIPGATSLISPRNALVVASRRPTLVWTATPDMTYDLMIRSAEGGGRPQIFEVGTDTTFTFPEDAELDAGGSYVWTVFVGGRMGGRPIPEQRFRVMTLEESVDLEDYIDEIAVFGLDPLTDGLFLTVVAYRDLGLFYDAHEALESVERQASLSADLYLLKGEILIELGHEEAAREAFDKADELMR
jgi:hypothetical protein